MKLLLESLPLQCASAADFAVGIIGGAVLAGLTVWGLYLVMNWENGGDL